MPSGPIGSVWAAGTWADTAWEAGTWADQPVPSPDSSVFSTGLTGLLWPDIEPHRWLNQLRQAIAVLAIFFRRPRAA